MRRGEGRAACVVAGMFAAALVFGPARSAGAQDAGASPRAADEAGARGRERHEPGPAPEGGGLPSEDPSSDSSDSDGLSDAARTSSDASPDDRSEAEAGSTETDPGPVDRDRTPTVAADHSHTGAEPLATDSSGEDAGRADEADENDETAEADERLDHEYQVGLRFGAGVPFVFALRYADGPRCASNNNTFCVFVGSGLLDGELSFGVTPDLEVTLMGRLGMVGVEPTNERQILLGLGIRNYLSPESMFKFFLGAKLILDVTPAQNEPGWGPVDVGARGEAGVQLDIVRYFGLYLQLGVNITVLRAFGISPDATGGVQVRFP